MAKKKKAAKKPKKKAGKEQKVLMHRRDGAWEEWAAWHLGARITVPPEQHLGWEIIKDRDVTQADYIEEYDRWVKMEWSGDGSPFELF